MKKRKISQIRKQRRMPYIITKADPKVPVTKGQEDTATLCDCDHTHMFNSLVGFQSLFPSAQSNCTERTEGRGTTDRH